MQRVVSVSLGPRATIVVIFWSLRCCGESLRRHAAAALVWATSSTSAGNDAVAGPRLGCSARARTGDDVLVGGADDGAGMRRGKDVVDGRGAAVRTEHGGRQRRASCGGTGDDASLGYAATTPSTAARSPRRRRRAVTGSAEAATRPRARAAVDDVPLGGDGPHALALRRRWRRRRRRWRGRRRRGRAGRWRRTATRSPMMNRRRCSTGAERSSRRRGAPGRTAA